MLHIFSFLAVKPVPQILDMKIAQAFPEVAAALKNRTRIPNIAGILDADTLREIEEMKTVYNNFSKYINLNIHKEFFRLFCNNKYVEYDYFLRADMKSFHEGVTYLYGGVENIHMSNRIFNYISKGKVNHRITFSEFVYFTREL